jgi:RHS repeat-associated protein
MEDALGSTRGLTGSSQAATDALRFHALGLTTGRSGSTPTPFGFAGNSQYQTDADTGLMLLGHRYYDARVGRSLTSDPAQDGENRYAYHNMLQLLGNGV